MSRNPYASHPLMLGFEEVERLAERASKAASDGYPPYNVEQRGEGAYRITLAVAGFAPDDLGVTLEGGQQLLVRGRKPAEGGSERQWLHRGIAARAFQRSFVLAEGIEVGGATLSDGLLHIDLRRVEPEHAVRDIPIVVA